MFLTATEPGRPLYRKVGFRTAGRSATFTGRFCPQADDLDPDRRDIAAWAEAHGLPQTAETAFMIRGPWPPPGDRDRLYAPITVALG